MTRDIALGYVPLVDAAPLIIADALGFAEEQGLRLVLHRAANWSMLRDMLDQGQVAAAQMLSVMPVARALGLGGGDVRLETPLVLSLGGQVVGVSSAVADGLDRLGHGFGFGDAADVAVSDAPMPDGQATAANDAQAGQDDLEGTGLDGITSLIEENVPAAGKAKGKAKSIGDLASAGDVSITNEGREFGGGSGESHLTLKAKAPVWVRIEDSHGNVVMTQMLMKGDTYRVPDREGLVVIARDGGLLTYMIDGKEKGILGTPGEILVGRSLDIKSFES